MNQTTLREYEAALRELRSALQAEVDETSAESAPVALDGTMGRVSRGDALQVQQVALEVKRRRVERLQRIETALLRVEQGTYGTCPRCRKPIGKARLDAFPEVVLCVGCASTPGRM